MALIHTPNAELGTACPDFALPKVTGGMLALNDLEDFQALLVMFICNHCPYVQAVEDRLIHLANEFQPQGVAVVAICSNDAKDYPDDAPDALRQRAIAKNYPFPYLHDETQAVAKAFGAVCTPDFFVYDDKKQLAYRGRLDDSWKDPSRVTSRDLSEALRALCRELSPKVAQIPSMGCSIKWKKS